jgi:hypothetical protein
VADRVHTSMKAMEPPVREPIGDRRVGEPERGELAPRHDSVLTARKVGDRPIPRLLDENRLLYS